MSSLLGVVTAGAAHAAVASIASVPVSSPPGGASTANLTITAVAAPAAGHVLYPGGTGDAMIKISNPNAFAVTITAVQLPTDASYAVGYRDPRLSSPAAGCGAGTPSGVTWNFANRSRGSSHRLARPLTVAGKAAVSVALTKDVSMASNAPAACAGAYFALPALTGVTASGGSAIVTSGPATDAWTS